MKIPTFISFLIKEQYTNISCFCNGQSFACYTTFVLFIIQKCTKDIKKLPLRGLKTSLDSFFSKQLIVVTTILQLVLVCYSINYHVNLPYHYTSIVAQLVRFQVRNIEGCSLTGQILSLFSRGYQFESHKLKSH